MANAIIEQYPDLVAGYDTENESYYSNAEMLRKASEKQRALTLTKRK